MLRALLTSNQASTRNSSEKKKHLSTEAYFDKKWGRNAAFEKTVDRTSFAVEEQDQSAEIHEQILVLHRTKTADAVRTTFLDKIAGDSMQFIREQRERMAKARQEEQLCHNSMAAMTEHIFELLKSYAYELNSALGFGPLHLASTNPKAVSEVVKFNRLRQPEETVSYNRARLSTPSFSLVLRGDKSGIQFFIMPVARAIGLSKQESHFQPVLRLSTRLINGSVAWETEHGQALTPSLVEVICMNLFHSLIEETKNQMRSEITEEEEKASSVS